MECGSPTEGPRQAVGVRQVVGEGEGVVAALDGLIRIAEMPEDTRQKDEACDPRIVAVVQRMGTVTLGIVEANALLEVRSCRRQLAIPQQGIPHRPVALDEERWLLHVLSHS